MFRRVGSIATDFLKRGRRWINRHGYDLHPVDQRCWEDQVALLAGLKEAVIFDVGASVGDVAAQYRALFPNCRLFCFEPQQDSLSALKGRFPDDSRISFHPVAVGAAQGTARLNITAAPQQSSLLGAAPEYLPPSYRAGLAVSQQREVPVITLDDFAAQTPIERIDLLKLDVQGGEHAILQGSAQLLAAHKIGLIYLEVGYVPLYANHPLLGDIAKILARHDYTLHFLYNSVINGRTGRMVWGDAIFVGPQLYEVSRDLLKKNWGAPS